MAELSPWEDAVGVVEFPDGRRVRGRGLSQSVRNLTKPDFGVYLFETDPVEIEWQYEWIPWRDFGLPIDTNQALATLRPAHTESATKRIELACEAGIGRTGTAMSIFAILSGVPVEGAVEWVRNRYRPDAVETEEQRAWILEAASLL